MKFYYSLSAIGISIALLFFLEIINAFDYDEDPRYFFVSQIHPTQNWCFAVPDMGWPPSPQADKTLLEFGLCQQYFDEYYMGRQSWLLDSEGRLRNLEYSFDFEMCVKVGNNDDSSSECSGRLKFAQCDPNSDLNNKFTYDPVSKNLMLATTNTSCCVTNSGVSPNVDDFMHLRECGSTGRFQFQLEPARRHWEILSIGGGNCGTYLKPSKSWYPTTGDSIRVESWSDGPHGWRYESTGSETQSILLHFRQHDSLCLQAGVDHPPQEGTQIVLYPCDKSNDLQRLVQEFRTDDDDYSYQYKLTLEKYRNLCVTTKRDACPPEDEGDDAVLKDCSRDGMDHVFWYDDED